jgi:2-polyprenyl-3-methyl-5-hydroxy-6-metoxy-1,4-benzoquinol methylase
VQTQAGGRCRSLTPTFAPCDLCGSREPEFLLHSQRLDGPLVRCRSCGLVYVGRRDADFTFKSEDQARSAALANRVAELNLVSHEIEQAEQPLRLEVERERLARLRRHVERGTLLDLGCATGSFLTVARETFLPTGAEPDPGTSEQARAAGHAVITGTVQDVSAPPGGFDAVTMFHVIEHLDSPRNTLERVRERLSPAGVVMIETPTVDCLWFRLAPRRWRQLIPDHYYFFSRATLEALLRRCDLEPIAHDKVSRRVSLRFIADRMRRSGLPLSGTVAAALRAGGLEARTLRVNPGDIMTIVAIPRSRSPGRHPRRP